MLDTIIDDRTRELIELERENSRLSRVISKGYKEALSVFVDLEEQNLIQPRDIRYDNVAALDASAAIAEFVAGQNDIPGGKVAKSALMGWLKKNSREVNSFVGEKMKHALTTKTEKEITA